VAERKDSDSRIQPSSARHMLWLVVGRATRSVFMLAAMVITARHLGPHDFGLVSFAISMALLFTIFPGPGLDTVLTQELVRRPNERTVFLGSALAIYLSCAVACYLLLLGAGFMISDTRSVWILIAICGISYLPRATSVLTAFFDSQLGGRYVMISETIQALAGFAIRLILIWKDAGTIAFVLAWVVDWAILAIVQWFIFNNQFVDLRRWHASWSIMRILLRRIVPLAMSGVMILVYQQIDKVMLKVMIDANTVGQYSLALRFVYAGAIIPILGVRALAPKLFEMRERDDSAPYRLRAQYLHDITTCMSLTIMLALAAAAPLLPYICGPNYAPSVIVMIIAAPLVVGVTMGAASGQQMVAEELQRLAPLRNGVGCGVNIILNLLLIPRLGAVGAALATICAALTASFFCMAFIPGCRHIFRSQLRAVVTGPARVVPLLMRHTRWKS
jgi:O-antigen/teichoic acid export membrane protein